MLTIQQIPLRATTGCPSSPPGHPALRFFDAPVRGQHPPRLSQAVTRSFIYFDAFSGLCHSGLIWTAGSEPLTLEAESRLNAISDERRKLPFLTTIEPPEQDQSFSDHPDTWRQ